MVASESPASTCQTSCSACRARLRILPTLLLVASFSIAPARAFVVPSSSKQYSSLLATKVDKENALQDDPSEKFVNKPLQQLESSELPQVANTLNDDKRQSPDMQAYASGYTTVFAELPFASCTPSSGTLPADLVGTYFRAGPAMFSAGSIVPPKTSIVQPRHPVVADGVSPERMVCHPMEGDGAVLGVTFHGDNSGVSVRYRFVRTAGFTNERKKGARIYTGMDGTRQQQKGDTSNDFPLPAFRHHLQPGLNKKRKNTSNTRAVYWGKRLLTLCEGSQPYKLDALGLSTDGRSRLGGAIRKDADPFGSKLSHDALNNRALFYGVEHGVTDTKVSLYEFDADFRLVPDGLTTTSLPGFALIHDFASTTNYAVFMQPSVSVNKMQFMVNKEPGKSITLQDEPGILHLIPRIGTVNQDLLSIPLPNLGPAESNIHFCNAYEEGTTVIVDAILSDGSKTTASTPSWPWCSTLEEYQSLASKKSLWRYEVDTQQPRVISKRKLSDDQCYFGIVNPAWSGQKHRYVYAAVGGEGSIVAPPQGIVRYDCQTGESQSWLPTQPSEFCGEPMYAPRTGENNDEEDSGYIITVTYDGSSRKESDLLVFLASNISAGPITRIPLGIGIPHGLHGCFSKEATWQADALERRAKLADKMESRGNMWNEVKSEFSGLGLRLDDMEEYFGDFFN